MTKRAKGSNAAPEGPAAPKEAPEGLSQDELAKRVGCAPSTVWRAIGRGDIQPLPNGRLPESAADIMRELRAKEAERDAVTSDLERRLLAAQAGEREAKMKLRQLELDRESGRFVELELVQRAGADAAQRILAVLRAIPQRIALEVDGALSAPPDRRAAAVEKIVAREVERAIEEMRQSLYLQAGTTEGNT